MVTQYLRKRKSPKKTKRLRKITTKSKPFWFEYDFEKETSIPQYMSPDRQEEQLRTWNQSASYNRVKQIIKDTLFSEGKRDYFGVVDRFAIAYMLSNNRAEFGKRILSQPRKIKRIWFDWPDRYRELMWMDDELFWPDGSKRYHDDDVKLGALLLAASKSGYELPVDTVLDLAETMSANAEEDRRPMPELDM